MKIQSDQQLAALASGNVDAALPDAVFGLQAANAGQVNILATGDDFIHYPWTLLQARKSWIQKNLDAAKGYVAAVDEAIKFINDPANKQKVIDDVVAESNGSAKPETVAAAYGLVVKTPNYFTSTLDRSTVETGVRAVMKTGAIKSASDINIDAYLSGMDLVK